MAAWQQKLAQMAYRDFRDVAFFLNAEVAHDLTLIIGQYFPYLGSCFGRGIHPGMDLKVGSVVWPFPVGLAAGLDKNAQALDFFGRMPLGCIECGTVTPRPQPGNARPRLWRYVEEESLRNAMGFNNRGMQAMKKSITAYQKQLAKRPAAGRRLPLIGVNLGKNKSTFKEAAPQDYRSTYQTLAPLADFVVLNVSSPNTPGLRDLQNQQELPRIFEALADVRQECPKDLYLKVAPDLEAGELPAIIECVAAYKLTGVVATNTTIIPSRGNGGCSGKILKAKAKQVRQQVLHLAQPYHLEVIGVGGVDSFADLWEFWQLGGKVMQLFSAFIFQGPPLLYDIQSKLETLLKMHKFASLEELRQHSAEIKLPAGF
ncbi:MAG: quinone-dependent dihydroorotate dehydrogenase [Bacteriovoracaceae bacterium]|nr:quinone-dependent dihydroorotate dehydrogenase [Bacteriovoracaceae bacterium]